ncbi:multicopper oxidase family protein [Falsihalocynthiibacter sp. BN13B15]|uniref:multicopper oxidase family protein n=1 Tax=Falsihalocynthiibacter sp. BN13B15 TaxID=3240871 RepID=UPI00350F9693
MTQTRRDVLQMGAAFGVAAMVPTIGRAQTADMQRIVARPASVQLAPPEYPKTDIWGYDGKLPGPEIRVPQGGPVARRFVNELPQASSMHWHGLRIENAMDGVAGLTQEAVPTGETFDYEFVAPDAGTYWYHAHNRSTEQVARGLYGALIVEEPTPADVDRDEVLILDDWLLDPETGQLDPDFDAPHNSSHAGRRGNFIATNGSFDTTWEVPANTRLRLRLINAANARVFQLGLSGLEGWVMALDGMPLETPEPIPEMILMAPGQRVDLFVDVTAPMGETAHLVRIEEDQGYSQAAFSVVDALDSSKEQRGAPVPLPPNPNMDVPNLETARRITLDMEGGAMGRLETAVLDGERMDFRELVAANQFWSFNGVVGMTQTPLASLARGETARMRIANNTVFPHAMHLHGMHFREIAEDGTIGPLRDTLLIFGDESREIAFVADNPGKWLFHCHMLSHAASGMMTWIEVA